MSKPELPSGRYGRSTTKRAPRWAYPVLLGVMVLVGSGIALVGYNNIGRQPIEGKQTAFAVLGDDSVRMRFEVAREEPNRPAVCIVRARSQDGDEVGRREVYIPPGRPTVEESTVVRTSRRSVTGLVFGCSYQVPEYLSSPARPSG